MKVSISIEIGNDCMRTGSDLAWALCDLAEKQVAAELQPGDKFVIRDINGNRVGTAEVAE